MDFPSHWLISSLKSLKELELLRWLGRRQTVSAVSLRPGVLWWDQHCFSAGYEQHEALSASDNKSYPSGTKCVDFLLYLKATKELKEASHHLLVSGIQPQLKQNTKHKHNKSKTKLEKTVNDPYTILSALGPEVERPLCDRTSLRPASGQWLSLLCCAALRWAGLG